jgi:hypothetical protein
LSNTLVTPAEAFWNQRRLLADNKRKLTNLFHAVASPGELELYQWAQMYAYAIEYQPDIILELGREYGNSTCVFTEAAHVLQALKNCTVLSICWSDKFEKTTVPRLIKQDIINKDWLSVLKSYQDNILNFPYEDMLDLARRVLVFWDAHGFEVAGCVLGRILPILENKSHVVLVHDLSDQRYISDDQLPYGDRPLWSGDSHSESRLILGHINTAVAQAISILDFCSRNKVHLESADHTFHQYFQGNSRYEHLKNELGEDLVSLYGHWFYFTLNDNSGPFTYPQFVPKEKSAFEETAWRLSE